MLVVIVYRLHLLKCFEVSHPLGFASLRFNSTFINRGHLLILPTDFVRGFSPDLFDYFDSGFLTSVRQQYVPYMVFLA